MIFGKGSKELMGLDIGSRSIKLVKIKETRGAYRLENMGLMPLPFESIIDGSLMNYTAVVDTIRELIDSLEITHKKVATSISGTAVIIKNITVNKMSTEELEDQILWEAEQYVPFNIDEVNIDFYILDPGGEEEDEMSVLLVAAKKEMIGDYQSVIVEAGLEPIVLDIDSFALQNIFEMNYHAYPNEVNALVNIGASVMNINIVKNGKPVFTRDVPMGGNIFSEEIQKALSLNFEEAEAVKLGEKVEGLEMNEATIGGINRATTTASASVASEVKRTLDFFLSSSGEEEIGRLFLSGGVSKVEGFENAIQEKTDTKVEILNPFENIEFGEKKFEPDYISEMAPLMAIAAGLSLRRSGDK